jgi:hypothetical protein
VCPRCEWVPSSPKSETSEQPTKLSDLFSKCSELAAEEERQMGKFVGAVIPVLGFLGEPVSLRPESLGGYFLGFKSVTLGEGAMVTMTDPEGRVSSKQLSAFRTEERLAILEESFPELQRLVSEKRRAWESRPALSLRAALGGMRFIVDMRSYRVVVANAGGDCLGVRFSTGLSGGRRKSSRPCDVGRGQEVEVDLGVAKEVGEAGRLEIEVECKDADGRELFGKGSVGVDGASQVVALAPTA